MSLPSGPGATDDPPGTSPHQQPSSSLTCLASTPTCGKKVYGRLVCRTPLHARLRRSIRVGHPASSMAGPERVRPPVPAHEDPRPVPGDRRVPPLREVPAGLLGALRSRATGLNPVGSAPRDVASASGLSRGAGPVRPGPRIAVSHVRIAPGVCATRTSSEPRPTRPIVTSRSTSGRRCASGLTDSGQQIGTLGSYSGVPCSDPLVAPLL